MTKAKKSAANGSAVKKNVVVNLFADSTLLQGRQLIKAKSEVKKAVNRSLVDFGTALDAAFSQVVKSGDKQARDCGNAAKGKYKTAAQIVAACYPYQTADGILCRRVKQEDGSRVWAEKPLTAAGARGIIRDSLRHFTETLKQPQPLVVVIGQPVE